MTSSESTAAGLELPWGARTSRPVKRVPQLVLAWSLDEPERLGECFPVEGATSLGRGTPLSDDPAPRGSFLRNRPGLSRVCAPIASSRISPHLVGCDLSELVKLFGPLPPERAVHFATQACRSLEEAHDKGLVHRDVKPSNLFAAEVGDERDVLKLLDFGIARSLLEGTHSNATRTGTVRGTPAYLSPECCKGEPATPASDLYGLGATLYHLVTGSPPFVGDDLSIVAQHREDPPVRPSVRRGAELPAGLEEIILRCLAKAPAERFSSARTLREALERCEGVTSWEPSDAARFWEQERKETVRRWTDETRA